VAGDRERPGLSRAEAQIAKLQTMRVLLEDARALARNLAYHRRAQLEAQIGIVLEAVDRHIADLREELREERRFRR
jgi:hypothetical protein